MDERRAHTELVSKATMKIGGEYVDEIVPEKYVRNRNGKLICWIPGETLPRYAKKLRDMLCMDVAVGDMAYYVYDPTGRAGRSKGRRHLAWWVEDTHRGLVLSEMTMEVR